MLSVLIPARNEIYLEKTLRNIQQNAEGEIEVITVLDGWLPEPQIEMNDKRFIFLHYPESIGQRKAINEAARRAKGKYVMKLDAHCAVDKGFDVKLAADCEYDWTIVPRMYNLDINTFTPKMHKRTDYMFMGWNEKDELRSLYYTGQEWRRWHRKTELVDETMGLMGPCFFMHKDRFWELGGCDEGHGGWGQQGVEVACKAWLSGGKLMVNKKTWFAHWFRGDIGFPYPLSGRDVGRARKYSKDLWINNKWPMAKYDMKWLVEKFNPPTWEGRVRVKKVSSQFGHIKATNKSAEELWNNMDKYWDRRKLERLKQYKEAILPFYQAVHSGYQFTDKEILDTPYYKYVESRLPSKYIGTRRGTRHSVNKVKEAIKIYQDIKDNGLKAPIDFYRDGDRLCLTRGTKRIPILYVLGTKKVPCRVFNSRDLFNKLRPDANNEPDDTIHGLAVKQFMTHTHMATDKYWIHNYTKLYDRHLSHLRDKELKILEIGAYRGASMKLWQEAFPKAKVYGVDINDAYKTLAPEMTVFIGSQADPAFLQNTVVAYNPYDLIVDDGTHRGEDQVVSFKELWPSLNPGGFYVVEDAYMNYQGQPKFIELCKSLIDEMMHKCEIKAMHFYYNIVFMEKN